MFSLSILVMLTALNLISLLQIAANILVPGKIHPGPVLGAAIVCLATSLTGLAMALLIPSPVVGVACITIAALVNLLAVLTTGLDPISDRDSTQAMRALRGLVRLAIVGAPHETALAGIPGRSQSGAGTPTRRAPPPAAPPMRTAQTSGHPATYITADLLPRLLAAASQSARTTSRATRPARTVAPIPASRKTLTPRQQFIVPSRPNRLPTSSLAFLLSVDPEQEPDIFANARERMSELPMLAHRVSLVANDPGHPSIQTQSSSVWPNTFSGPDPVWKTSYGRLPALSIGI